MSRIGKIPVQLPQGVKTAFNAGVVSVEGPKGKLEYKLAKGIEASQEGSEIIVKLGSDAGPNASADYGTARATIKNMVEGVTKGWKRSLELNGVGFNAKMQGTKLVLQVGYSHDVVFEIPKEIKAVITKNTIDLESTDRQLVGTFAANIRKSQPPEPYLGKGIKFAEEKVRRKAGKTGKK
jgi:large subunit ribosomal protein L6